MGRIPALTPAQVEEAYKDYLQAPPKGKYGSFIKMADKFGVHYRTVQDAVYRRVKEEKARESQDGAA